MQLDHSTIITALKTWFRPGEVFEIRILEAITRKWSSKPHTEAGYFDYEHIDEIPSILESSLLSYKGIYVTANPLTSAVLGRSANHLKSGQIIGAKDEEVACRRWLLVDCDAKRVSGVSSSDEEHAHALAKAQEIKRALSGIGWPDPIELDSGNGAQLMYRVDLPTDDDGLIKRCLEQLKEAGDERTDIDQTVFNASRIWRLPGAYNCKGDECPSQTRIHRQSRILRLPQFIKSVPIDTLHAFAPSSNEASPTPSAKAFCEESSSFDLNLFLADHFPGAKPSPYNGGTKWVLDVCPFDPNHNNRSAVITQSVDGKIGFKCHHNGCAGKNWHDLRSLLAPKRTNDSTDYYGVDMSELFAKLKSTDNHEEVIAPAPLKRSPLEPPLASTMLSNLAKVSPNLVEILQRAPRHAPPIVDGLFREGEVVNVIAAPKTGKSWLVLSLALSIALGVEWQGFPTLQGNAYIIDNELHESAFSQRLVAEMEAMRISPEEIDGRVFARCVRSYMPTLDKMLPFFDEAKALDAKVIIIDAMYRALPRGFDENSNSDMRDFYNMLNRVADYTGAAIVLVHHTSKGIQAGKSVTDIGAGAGAISRAADTHIALRKHLSPNTIVLDAVTRTFTQPAPFCIHADPPFMVRDDSQDPRYLEGLTPQEIKAIQGLETADNIIENLTQKEDENEANVALDSVREIVIANGGEMDKDVLLSSLKNMGASVRLAKRLVNEAIECRQVFSSRHKHSKGHGYVYKISIRDTKNT